MAGFSLALADVERAEQFLLLGRTRRLFDGFTVHADRDGNAWGAKSIGRHTFAFTWLGPGWVFDAAGRERWAKTLKDRRQLMLSATAEDHRRELEAVLANLNLGIRAERVLWLIHQQMLRHRTSLLRLPDTLLAEAIWGTETRPTHWRQEILDILKGLTMLHVIAGPVSDPIECGAETALLTFADDMRGDIGDVCGEQCQGREAKHHHYLVNVGRGFFGVLEQFVREEDAGIRTYAFPMQGRSRRQSTSLRSVGRSGKLGSIYLPAKLGERAKCDQLTLSQHRLLQTLVRETTRNTKQERESVSEAEIIQGNAIPTINGKSQIDCELLEPSGAYVGFNGNKLLKGRGYLITSSGGWLARAGYSLDEARAFFNDLDVLTKTLSLSVVGMSRDNRFLNLMQLGEMANSIRATSVLRKVHLRVYAPSDYLERWNEAFGWSESLETDETCDGFAAKIELAISRGEISQADLAEGISVDRSLLSKVLRGMKPWPKGWSDRVTNWLKNRTSSQMGQDPAKKTAPNQSTLDVLAK